MWLSVVAPSAYHMQAEVIEADLLETLLHYEKNRTIAVPYWKHDITKNVATIQHRYVELGRDGPEGTATEGSATTDGRDCNA